MPDVEANRRQWDGAYAWPQSGDEWSAGWGGPGAQWHSTLLPRLRRFIPAPAILEIAPGYGRWTRYLVACCERYVGIDLSSRAVEVCRRRFSDVEHAEFHVNNGRSLAPIADTSIDLAFSFDSLVHVEEDVIGEYLNELSRVLTVDGVAFLHHSNLAACPPVARPLRGALRVAERIRRRDTGGFDQWRATTMSAQRFDELAADAGLACIGQEIVNWLGGRLLDCISLVTRAESKWERPNVVVQNPYFMAEAASSARVALLDAGGSRPPLVPASPPSPQRLGPLAGIATTAIGPWGVSIVGPLPQPPVSGAHRASSFVNRRRRGLRT
jgi:SAM-dependent methyltransferase